jgi:hypothetical protein
MVNDCVSLYCYFPYIGLELAVAFFTGLRICCALCIYLKDAIELH